jgi:hypothetical protein
MAIDVCEGSTRGSFGRKAAVNCTRIFGFSIQVLKGCRGVHVCHRLWGVTGKGVWEVSVQNAVFNVSVFNFLRQLADIKETSDSAPLGAGLVDVAVEVVSLQQRENSLEKVSAVVRGGRLKNCKVVGLVAQDDGGAWSAHGGRRYIYDIAIDGSHWECKGVERGVIPYDEDWAFSDFKGSKKVEVRGLQDVAKSPATCPFPRRRVEQRRREWWEKVGPSFTMRLPFLLKLFMFGIELKVIPEHGASL